MFNRRSTLMNADRPAAGTHCVCRFAGTSGEQFKWDHLGKLIGLVAMLRVQGALPAGISNAINAVFAPS